MGFQAKADIFQFIYDHQEKLPVVNMCKLYGVSPSGYKAWCSRPASERAVRDADLLDDIKRVFNDSDQTYGSPRVHAQLKHEGFYVGENRIARIMRENSIQAASKVLYNHHKGTKSAFFGKVTNKIKNRMLTAVDQV